MWLVSEFRDFFDGKFRGGVEARGTSQLCSPHPSSSLIPKFSIITGIAGTSPFSVNVYVISSEPQPGRSSLDTRRWKILSQNGRSVVKTAKEKRPRERANDQASAACLAQAP